jgi:Protein of unknown function (DUF3311)
MAYDASGEQRFTRQEPGGRRGVPVHERNTSWYWLFLIPAVFTLLPWIYNSRSPELFGMPFFYWYQMVWVPITVIITILVYVKTKGA